MSASDDLLDLFCDALWLEDGLCRSTLQSYRTDLRQFGEAQAARRTDPAGGRTR